MEDDEFYIDNDGFDMDAALTNKEIALSSLFKAIESAGKKGSEAISFGERNDLQFIADNIVDLASTLMQLMGVDDSTNEEDLSALVEEAIKKTTTVTYKNIKKIAELAGEEPDEPSDQDSREDISDDGTDF